MNVFELVQATNIKTAWEENKNRGVYVGEAFFPNTKQIGLKFEFIKGRQGEPVALVPAHWNTNVLYRDRIGVESLSGSLPFFKEAYKIDEETRQELLKVKDEFKQPLINRIFDDVTDLLVGADVAVERMRMQILGTGTITITQNGVNKQYDYGFDNEKQFKELSKKWSVEGADPIQDIIDQAELAEELFGEKPTIAVMDRKVFNVIRKNAKVLDYFAKKKEVNLYPSKAEVLAFVEAQTELRFLITDATYLEARDFNGTPVKYYPEDRITFLTGGNLGETVYGTTPEEADLLSGSSKASSVEVTSKGVAITTWNEVDPVNVNTKVSEVCIPTCPNIDKIYIVKVL